MRSGGIRVGRVTKALSLPDTREVLRDHARRRRLIALLVRGELELPGVDPELARAQLRGLVEERLR